MTYRITDAKQLDNVVGNLKWIKNKLHKLCWVVPYLSPKPSEDSTSYHRYVFLLCEEPLTLSSPLAGLKEDVIDTGTLNTRIKKVCVSDILSTLSNKLFFRFDTS